MVLYSITSLQTLNSYFGPALVVVIEIMVRPGPCDHCIIHKEKELDDVVRRFPAEHYVLVDDKLRILTAVKKAWGSRVTTVFPRQGHYARDPDVLATCPPADVTVERIADLLDYDESAFFTS